jgi:hypothetical protein
MKLASPEQLVDPNIPVREKLDVTLVCLSRELFILLHRCGRVDVLWGR